VAEATKEKLGIYLALQYKQRYMSSRRYSPAFMQGSKRCGKRISDLGN